MRLGRMVICDVWETLTGKKGGKEAMRRALCMTVVLTLLAGFIAVPAYAEEFMARPYSTSHSARASALDDDDAPSSSPPGELIMFDALVLRPLGIFSMFVGLGGTIAATPWAASSNSDDRVRTELLEKPFSYTFCRPVGDLE